jgi:hypothetical protein
MTPVGINDTAQNFNPYNTMRADVLQPAPVHPAVNFTWQQPIVGVPQTPINPALMNHIHTVMNNAAGIFQSLHLGSY